MSASIYYFAPLRLCARRFTTLALVFLIGSAACKNGGGSGHLPKKEMEKILLDINLAEAYSTTRTDSLYRAGMKNYDSLAVYYKTIFTHHKITQQQFEESLTWYKNHPDELDSVYTTILPIVTRWQTKN